MPQNQVVTPYDDAGYAAVARATAAVPVNTASPLKVRGAPGRLCRVIVTVAPGTTTGTTTIYDNATPAASGTPLLTIPNNAAVGTIYAPDQPTVFGITVGGSANCPGLTIGYS